jgi:hypothetical protein
MFFPEKEIQTFVEQKYHSILCANCLANITSQEFLFFVDGRNVFRFTNPSGITFLIRLFSKAVGSVEKEIPTEQFSWFPGFSWNFAHCQKCETHLGWKYYSRDKNFFGLIENKILYV